MVISIIIDAYLKPGAKSQYYLTMLVKGFCLGQNHKAKWKNGQRNWVF